MELVFLSNGQACYLKEKIGSKFIVNKIFEYEDGENGWQEISDDNDIVVDNVFNKPPIEKVDSEIKELSKVKISLNNEISELQSKKRTIEYGINQITKTQVNNQKFIINKTELINAKVIVLFPKGQVMPYTMDNADKSFRGLKISMEIKISEREERSWGYKLYYDRGNDYGTFLCEKYGILIDPTEDQIEQTIFKRLSEIEFDDNQIAKCDDKYLTEKQREIKNNFLSEKSKKDKAYLEKQIEEATKKLSQLNSELLVTV